MEYHSGGSLPLLGRPRYCPGANANGGYLCETGHCCGETGCCTYYYELWWFWLLWTVLILFSCCCAYRHRRAKLRVQQQQRQREISLLAYHGANSYPSSMLDLSFLASLKLPSYEEVAAQPSTPPPPYSSVFTTPRYPQPPRTSDPHLLTQHGPLLHQTLSDGPSSLSSDNSSSCSCDSCCPSSPCSSSLSAPVTYETDTSHATTPSEAAPFTLDVTLETIAAAANSLEVNQTRFESDRTVAAVAIDIRDEVASGAQEPISVDSSVLNQTVTVALVTKVDPTHSLPSPGSEMALPVESSSPTMPDLTPFTQTVSTCSSSTRLSPVVDSASSAHQATTPTTHSPKTTSTPDPSCDIPTDTQTLKILDLTRNVDPADVPSSSRSVPSPDVEKVLVLITDSSDLPNQGPNHSLVAITPPDLAQAPSPELSNTIPSNLSQAESPVPTNSIQASSTMHSYLTQGPDATPSIFSQDQDTSSANFTQVSVPVPQNLAQDPVPSSLTAISTPIDANLAQAPDAIPTNFSQGAELVSTNLNPSSDQIPKTVTHFPDQVPSKPAPVPNSQPQILDIPDYKPTLILNPNLAQSNVAQATDAAPASLPDCQRLELSPGLGPALGITSPRSDSPQYQGPALLSCPDPASSGLSLVLPLSSEPVLTCHSPSNVQTGLNNGSGPCPTVGSIPSSLSSPAPGLTVQSQAAFSFPCPAITVDTAFSLSPSQSPPTVHSPSSTSPRSLPSPPSLSSPPALSPTSHPAPALLLDPLTALHPSNKGGSSSGHASSLSPSPRATQSPPKQTLFSPCVDIFEPGPPSWEDDEEDQDQDDNYDDEDEDMGADESQYRHRRLTGDSGIEVCRCRMEEEDEEEEEEEEEEKRKEDGRKGGGGVEKDKKGVANTGLHDSVDCPARSQITTEEELLLCNSTSTTTPTSEDNSKVVAMETV